MLSRKDEIKLVGLRITMVVTSSEIQVRRMKTEMSAVFWKDCKRDFTGAALEVLPQILKTGKWRSLVFSSNF